MTMLVNSPDCLEMHSTSTVNGRRVKRTSTFWAERGLIRCIDTGDPDHAAIIRVPSFLRRLKALGEMMANSPSGKKEPKNVRLQLQNTIDRGIEIARKAMEYGSPFDPASLRSINRRLPLILPMSPDW